MKINLLLIIAVVLTSCSKPEKIDNDRQEIHTESVAPISETEDTQDTQKIDSVILNKNEDWLTPDYLVANFNNDNHVDTAFAIIIEGKKGFRIKHGGKNDEFLIGAGNKFGNGGDDFNWVNYWKLINDRITYSQTFAENGDILGIEEIKLEAPAFYLEEDEPGGATIAWIDGEYVWIHQAD